MLLYNLRIALLSLKRNWILSSVIVGGIALGIAVSTMFSTTRHVFARNPIPHKSDVLYYVRLDSWDPQRPYPGDDPTRPPTQITYRDMVEIMKSDIPLRQSGMFKSSLYVFPDPKVGRPQKALVRLVFADFFPMFDLPFKYGSGWDGKADAGPEPVVVLSQEENDLLFGGANSVGKTVRIEDREFRVVGVLDTWRPAVKFYDLTQAAVQAPEPIYMPLNFLRPMKLRTAGNSDGWGPSPSQPGFEGRLVGESCWLQMWVELPSKEKRQAYEDFLKAYVLEQKRTGRFPRPLNNRVTPVMAWMKEQGVVPKEVTAMMIVSLLFLAVCALNLMGLLLGKFLARAPEIGVRRALGARRLDIFVQHVVECELVGVIGGLIGVALALGGLAWINNWMKTVAQRGDVFQLDGEMAVLSFVLSLVAGLIAGVYPAWRVCRIAPAVHLKVQ
ncbi:MAG: ABC transporter substrate-binding protein [Acidobacteria bacterium]|nr:MAG: ABC transporter substrate-binding protein [Acidobacteriota bacterium]